MDFIQNFVETRATVIHESLFFVASFTLLSRQYTKKLLFYFFCLVCYFAFLGIAHASHIEMLIIPMCSIVMILGLYKTHMMLPSGASVRNNKYFILLLLMVIQNLMKYADVNIYYLCIYLLFALYLACRAYYDNSYHYKIFYTFCAFFVLTVAHVFTEHYVADVIEHTIFYSLVAYFVYSTMGVQYKKSITWVVAIQTILALMHICYTVVNPLYFLLAKLENQTVNVHIINIISIFAYSVIFLSALNVMLQTIKKPKTKKHTDIVKNVYTIIVLVTLLAAEIIHNVLYEISDIVYSMTFISFVSQIFYLCITFVLLYAIGWAYKWLKRKKLKLNFAKFFENLGAMRCKFQARDVHIHAVLAFVQENVNVSHRAVLLIMPVFLLFYLVMALVY